MSPCPISDSYINIFDSILLLLMACKAAINVKVVLLTWLGRVAGLILESGASTLLLLLDHTPACLRQLDCKITSIIFILNLLNQL